MTDLDKVLKKNFDNFSDNTFFAFYGLHKMQNQQELKEFQR